MKPAIATQPRARTKPTIAIISYDAGNIGSVANALRKCGAKTFIAKAGKDFQKADAIVLPGVGSFSCAKNLLKMRKPLLIAISKKPFLGICLGMQLLFEKSEEAKGSGLGIFKGKVQKLKCKKLPNVGWRGVQACCRKPQKTGSSSVQASGKLFAGIKKPVFYFCHSYAIRSSEDASALSKAGNERFVAALERKNLFAVQFHPEKSGKSGLKLLSNFVKIVQGA